MKAKSILFLLILLYQYSIFRNNNVITYINDSKSSGLNYNFTIPT